jgi:hypothetical protein
MVAACRVVLSTDAILGDYPRIDPLSPPAKQLEKNDFQQGSLRWRSISKSDSTE